MENAILHGFDGVNRVHILAVRIELTGNNLALLGHSSISITLNIYTHVLDNMMNEEIKKFGTAKTKIPEEYQSADFQKVITSMSHC